MTPTGTEILSSTSATAAPMRTLYIAVRMHIHAIEDADSQDLLIPGNYLMSVPASLSAVHGANCALDTFYTYTRIKHLNTMNIYVYDAQTKSFLERDANMSMFALGIDAHHLQKIDAGAPAALPAGFEDAVFGRECVYRLEGLQAMLAFLPAKDANRLRRTIQKKLAPLNRRLALLR